VSAQEAADAIKARRDAENTTWPELIQPGDRFTSLAERHGRAIWTATGPAHVSRGADIVSVDVAGRPFPLEWSTADERVILHTRRCSRCQTNGAPHVPGGLECREAAQERYIQHGDD